VGDIQNERFVPDQQVPENLEVINRLLSPSVWQIADSQYVAMAIIPDEIREVPTYQQGWAHLFSLPRVWTLRNGKICQMPLPALKQLRDKESRIAKENLVRSKLIYDGKRQVEIDAVFYPQDASQFGFQLQTNGGKEKSFIYYDVKKQRLVADHTKSSLQMGIPLEIRTGNLHLPMNSPVRFHLFIDGSVIEGFVNDEYAFTSRFFPKNAENVQVQLYSKKGKTEAEVKVWTLNGAKMKTNF
jgi:beta-fructofuranosidase